MVEEDDGSVEVRLKAGEIGCGECGGELRPWGYARERKLRDRGEQVVVRPRRGYCRKCLRTHVLLPRLALVRRMDVVEVIGEALRGIYIEGRSRQEVSRGAGAPMDTVRGWRRRLAKKAEEIRIYFTTLAHRWDEELWGIEAQGSAVLDALEAMGVAAAAAFRRFGGPVLWSLVSAASGGRLLSNTSCPLLKRS
jgi:hypothetical protein